LPSKIDLPSLVTYIIARLTDMEASFGKTKLVKLLYLIDVEFHRLYSRKLTELEWIFFHYGPYTHTIDDVLRQLDLDIPQEEVLTASGHKAKIFKPPREIHSEFENSSGAEKYLVDRVINQWGLEELNPLLSYIYFHTEPMQDAHRGDILDFSKIIHPLPTKKPVYIQISEEQQQSMQNKFEQTKEHHAKVFYKSLNPEPRFDDVFIQSLANIEISEQYYISKGEIDIENDSKEVFRQQTPSESQ